jgi:HAD superfamily hydrolase (TIGR01509 family)
MGNSTRNTFQKLKETFDLEHDVEDLILRKRTLFNDAFDKKEDLFLLDGVEKLIKDLHQNGMQLIVASSASKVTIDRVFTRFGLHSYFSHIVSGEDFPKSKPHPEIFIYAQQISNHSKEECLVIEDSTNGIKAAKSAELFCIAYDSFHSKMQDLSQADVVINHFSELNNGKILNYLILSDFF